MTSPSRRPGTLDIPSWEARFATADYVFGTAPNAFLARQLDRLSPGAEVLAACDGEGRNGVFLAQAGMRVTTFDAAKSAVAKALLLAAERRVSIDARIASVEDWTWEPARYDAVAAIFVQFAAPGLRARMFDGMIETLRPGGLLLLEGYRPEQLAYGTGGPPFADHMYTTPLLKQAFADHDILELVSYDAEIDEGAGHSGMSALIDCVVRRR